MLPIIVLYKKNPAFKYVDPISWNNLQKELKLSELVTFENVTSLCLWVGLTTFNVWLMLL